MKIVIIRKNAPSLFNPILIVKKSSFLIKKAAFFYQYDFTILAGIKKNLK